MKKVILYIHGQGGNGQEALQYIKNCSEYDVVGIDHSCTVPWIVKPQLINAYDDLSWKYDEIIIVANSIGAYFAMDALYNKKIARALFISPIVDMEKLIKDMMSWAHVSEKILKEVQEIPTDFGETLSWKYLCYVREHPLHWSVDTAILYGANDHLTSQHTIERFVENHKASLTVMENGQHWFHSDEELAFVNAWIKKIL